MAYIKAPVEADQEMYDYLEELRQSGETNMHGAAAYLEKEFGLDKDTAKGILTDWMRAHDNPERIVRD